MKASDPSEKVSVSMPKSYWKALDNLRGPYVTRSAKLQQLVADEWRRTPVSKRQNHKPQPLDV